MSFSVFPIPEFKRRAKPLLKKHRSLAKDLGELEKQLLENPFLGTPIKNGCYKIRLAISSKNAGKSGGARVITTVLVQNESIYLLTIYDKSEQDAVTDEYLAELVASITIEDSEE